MYDTYWNMRVKVDAKFQESSLDLVEGLTNQLVVVQTAGI